MEDNLNPIPEPQPAAKPEPVLMARGREFVFGGVMGLLSVLLCNFLFYGGAHLAFGILLAGTILCSWIYLKKAGHSIGRYEKTLLLLSIAICLGFGRSDDNLVKFYMMLMLSAAVNLALCIGAGQNRRNPQGAMSLLDAPRALLRLGMGNLGRSAAGLSAGIRQGGAAARRVSAVGTGLLISVPLVAVMLSLLISADAAFEGLMKLLPELKPQEYFVSGIWGILLAWVLYSRGVSLAKCDRPAAARSGGKGANTLTVNTVLLMVCLVYLVYLLSQLAYVSGGLSGILPEGFTLAEYARRGFFEMSALCTGNLGILCVSLWLIRREKLPGLTRIAGTFLAVITVFLIFTASAKMFLYIGSYGLTWSRVTTEVFMLWLAITTVLVAIRLFLPRFGYMKAVVLSAMVLGTLVVWVDVNTLVANYNVKAYREGRLETVDVRHLKDLGSAAIPRLLELAEDSDPEVAEQAREILERDNYWSVDDFRGWNYTRAKADRLLTQYHARRDEIIRGEILELLGLDIARGRVLRGWDDQPVWREGSRMLRICFEDEAAEAFARQTESAGWENMPAGAGLQTVMSRELELFRPFRDSYITNKNNEGFWYFRNYHPDAVDPADPEELLTRGEYHFLTAYYNSKTGKLYLFQVEKPAAEAAAPDREG